MSKVECTAVNELIDLVQRKPLDHRDSEEELLFASPEPRRAAAARPRPLFSVEIPTEPTEARATMPVIWTRTPQFEPTPRQDDDQLRTVAVGKHLPIALLAKRLALPMAGLLVVGIAIGGVITFSGEGKKHTTHVSAPSPFAAAAASVQKPQPIEAPAPVAAPVAEPAPAPAPVVAQAPAKPLVEVRIESNPPGATATLLDNGASTPLGTTPVDATIDPSKSYDVVIAMEGHASKIQHLDPTATQKLQVALDDAAPETPAPVVAKAKAKTKKHHHAAKQAARVAVAPTSRPAPKATSSDPIAKLAAAKTGKKDAAAPVAMGTLSIATTPPCAILIDGTNSGLTTPQGSISLAAGHHTIRLIAAPQHVNKLVAVDISPRKTTRLVQDFTK